MQREGNQESQSIPDPCAKGREQIRARRTTAVVAAIDVAFQNCAGAGGQQFSSEASLQRLRKGFLLIDASTSRYWDVLAYAP